MLRILVLCDVYRDSPNTIVDHVGSFGKYSRNSIFYFNPRYRKIPFWLNLDDFDVIVIHYSIYILTDYYIDASWRMAIAYSRALKVQFIQDEYRQVCMFRERMRELKVDVLFTCIPEAEIDKVYPETELPGVIKINTLTGYVPERYVGIKQKPIEERSVDVGYRARGIGFWWLGELYQEKSRIGLQFIENIKGAGLKCDISSREKDRIYGKKWIDFLQNCKCTLGTESGASVIDFTGDIEKRVKEYCCIRPAASFEEVQNLFFKDLEGQIRMNQISPRIFEAIACRTALILFEGEYSGVIEPGKHYVQLKKDFSNIENVFEAIRNIDVLKTLTDKAYTDIILSGAYSYRSFISFFDSQLLKLLHQRRRIALNDSDYVLRFDGKKERIRYQLNAVINSLLSTLNYRINVMVRRIHQCIIKHPFLWKELIHLYVFQERIRYSKSYKVVQAQKQGTGRATDGANSAGKTIDMQD